MFLKADEDLDPAQFGDLNREFFGGEGPARYFRARQRILAAAATNQIPPGVLNVERYSLLADDAGIGREFATTEAVSLLHHCAETTWRLFLSQEPPSTCPPLELGRIRGPGDFKRRLTRFQSMPQAARRDRCRAVLAPDEQHVADHDSMDSAVESAELLLPLAARHFLDEANLYNATKHGLNVRSDMSQISLGVEETGVFLERSGTWMKYLEIVESTSGGGDMWMSTSAAIALDASLGEVGFLIGLLAGMWSVGRCRFAGEEHAVIALPDAESIRDLVQSEQGIRKVRHELAYVGLDGQQIKLDIAFPPPAADDPAV